MPGPLIATRRSTGRCMPARSPTPRGSGPSRPGGSTGSRPPSRIKDVDFAANARIRWYEDGILNVAYNCIDRHLETRGDQTAILWEGDDPKVDAKITYRELHRQVGKLANVLKGLGVRKGDRVTIYMPMIPRDRLRDAGLRADRRDPLGGVRRLLARFARRPDQRLRQQARDHHRRRQARRPQRPAQGATPTKR